MTQRLILRYGDCVDVLKGCEDGSIGAVVSDPPYGLEFMGKKWDRLTTGNTQSEMWSNNNAKHSYAVYGNTLPRFGGKKLGCKAAGNQRVQRWHLQWLAEAYRVLRPGGVIKAFSGTRTFHRMAAAMAEAGFVDLRVESWNYGSGFPKSHNVAVYLDKMIEGGKCRSIVRKGVGNLNGKFGEAFTDFVSQSKNHQIKHPEARAWDGWGTALKPSWEPVIVGRKPE
jgi:DNA modification methylase